MKTRQYSVKVFEVEITDEQEFILFFEKNYIILKNHLISIHGLFNTTIEKYLKSKNLKYITNIELPREKASKTSQERAAQQEVKKNLIVKDSLVRSGQELKLKGDLLLLNRVNSGGTIDIDGNLIITQIVDGSIRCYGDFMMIKASSKANILFHDVEIDNKYLNERLNRVELINNEIQITPVVKETNWV